MKTLKIFSTENEARVVRDLLLSRGLSCEIIGAKEYASHVLGGAGSGRYELLVLEGDLTSAQEILRSIPALSAATEVGTPNYFKRSLFFAIAAMIVLPVVFNFVSILNGKMYWQNSDRGTGAKVKVLLLLLLQLPGLVTIPIIWKLSGGDISIFGMAF